jgi:hypothetical protein
MPRRRPSPGSPAASGTSWSHQRGPDPGPHRGRPCRIRGGGRAARGARRGGGADDRAAARAEGDRLLGPGAAGSGRPPRPGEGAADPAEPPRQRRQVHTAGRPRRVDAAPAVDDPDLLELRVADSGIGIPGDKLEAVFQPFVQVDVARIRTTEGSGLGLAISRDLARGMGGDLAVRSILGQGSTFTLRLARPSSGPRARSPRLTAACCRWHIDARRGLRAAARSKAEASTLGELAPRPSLSRPAPRLVSGRGVQMPRRPGPRAAPGSRASPTRTEVPWVRIPDWSD